MSTPVELIVGPARSGKACRVLAAYLEAYARAGPGRCLMLVPTAARRRQTESRLLAAQGAGVLAAPQVFTLPDLADRILTAAGTPLGRITELARRQIIRQCLGRLDEKQAAVLGAARETPGLVDALDALFRELKAARIEPDAFGRALAAGLRTPRNRLLAHLYADYQRTLQARDLYDDAGQFWHAAALLAQGRFGPFRDLAILAVDGFQDFAPAQLDVLQALAGQAQRTIITLLWEPDAARQKLYGVTGRTRQRLRERFGPRLVETAADAPGGLTPDLEQVRRHLFRLMDPGERPAAGGAIRIIRAAGRTREVEEIARRVVGLLREGGPPGPAGAKPGRIAILARSLEPYAALVREVFPRYGIPFRVERPRPLSECPVVRAAMMLLRLQTENYGFRALGRLLKSNYFRPEAFDATAETARAAVRLAREANVWEGRDRYFQGLEYLRNQYTRAAERPEDAEETIVSQERASAEVALIERVRALLERLFSALELPARAARGALAERLGGIIRQAGLWKTVQADREPLRRARDLKALAALEDVLAEVAALDEHEGGQVPLETFLAEVNQGLDLAEVSAEEPPAAPVLVMDALQCRALTFDHVFLAGLAEKAFPRRARQHPFFSDAERQDLRRRGVELQESGHEAEHEMLFYYVAATRASQTLTLSYPSLDAQGRPALASHYLDQVEELFAAPEGGRALPPAEVTTRDLDPPDAPARSEREVLALSMFRIWGPGPTPDMDVRLGVLDELLHRGGAAEAALAGLAIEWEREHGEAFGPFDGVLAADDILEDLCMRIPGRTPMSARRLERFGGCPFAFLAGDLLGLEPVEEPSRDLGPLDLGLICHALLERFFAALAAAKEAGRLSQENRAAAQALLAQVAEQYFADLEARGRVGSPALWKVQRRKVLRDLAALVDWHAAAREMAAWRPAHTEVAFGAAGAGAVAPPGRHEPIRLTTAHGTLALRGRIDRIDLAAEGDGWQVVDYKSGSSAPTPAAMQAGTSFQLPVYLWAAGELLGRPADGVTQAFFLPVRKPRRTGLLTTKATDKHPEGTAGPALDLARRYIENFLDAMRQGKFPVLPRSEDACSARCPFREICRYAQWRIRRKIEANPIPQLAVLEAPPDEGAREDAP